MPDDLLDGGSVESTEPVEEVQEDATTQEETSATSPEETQETEYTEKGTRLDPNPQSRAYQELANERRIRQQYEGILSNKESFEAYAKQAGFTKAEVKEATEQLFTPDKLKTVDDLSNAFNQLHGQFSQKTASYEKEIQDLRQKLSGIDESRRLETTVQAVKSDISSVREKYPELDPKSQTYDKELEKEIGLLYEELDRDQATGLLRGQVSLAKLTERVMSAAKRARQAGSKEAQTQVRVKQSGRVVTSQKSSNNEASESDLSAEAVIAKRMAGMFNK